MAISSVSTRIYDAPDDIMETDLELLGKVNVFQQTKFNEGSRQLQDEINKWSMLADVAKPQDREYINTKLNNLVSGIQGMGGVNLGDPNEVNSLKSLGYNLYGDNAVLNAVSTTNKMRGFMKDGQSKLAGKNAANYDSALYEYNMNQWNDWLSDGQTGSSYNGPQQLSEGNFTTYQKRVQDAIGKLTPDLNEAPQGTGEAINYVQVGTKFIKKERIKTLIDSMTTANDMNVINAHAWKNMAGMQDDQLLKLTTDSYTAKVKGLQGDYNTLKHQLALTSDFNQKEAIGSQMDQIQDAIKSINGQKSTLFEQTNGKPLDNSRREQIRTSLYYDAYKDGAATAYSFEQNKTELKYNQGRAFQLKEARAAYEFGQTLGIRKSEFDLDVRKQDFEETKWQQEYGMLMGMSGPGGTGGGAPLAYVDVNGETGASKYSDKSVVTADANYAVEANNFYQTAYNQIGLIGDYADYVVRDQKGNLVPKDEASKKILDQAVATKVSKFDDISRTPLEKRDAMQKSLSEGDVSLFQQYKSLQEAQLYKTQMNDLEDQAFAAAGKPTPRGKIIYAYASDANGNFQQVGMYNARQLKEMKDHNDPRLAEWEKNGVEWREERISSQGALNEMRGTSQFTKDLKSSIFSKGKGNLGSILDDYYSSAGKGWDAVSKTYIPLGANVSIPKQKGGKPNENLAKYFADQVTKVNPSAPINIDDVDVSRVWVQHVEGDPNGPTKYFADIRYSKGTNKTPDRVQKNVDLTTEVLRDPNSWVARLYPQDNAEVIYGMLLSKNGSTPFSEANGYADALKTSSNLAFTHNYRINKVMDRKTGSIDHFTMDMVVPRSYRNGAVKNIVVPVINSTNMTTNFPPNFQAARQYMDEHTKTAENVKRFYQLHNISTK